MAARSPAYRPVAADLAKAIEWMYYHPNERRQMGVNAYQFARQQDWELKVDRLVETYYKPILEPNNLKRPSQNPVS